MTKQMIIRLDSETKDKLQKLATSEGKNTSQVVRELIEDYIQNRDIGSYIDDLWDRVRRKVKNRNVSSGEIDRAIYQSRTSLEAQTIISGHKEVLRIENYMGIEVLSPKMFLENLQI